MFLHNGTLEVSYRFIVMTIANSFAAKLSVAFVAIAMALMMFAPAKAQTTEELQAQINSLMATINALQAQLGTAATTPAGSMQAYVFTRSLTVGAQGADVTALQNYLIKGGYSIPAGATGYFGAQTQAAVAAWQAANGIAPAAGYFGPISQAKYTALMAAMNTGTGSTGSTGSSTGSTGSTGSVTLNGGESSIDNNFNLREGDETSLTEGQEDAPVAVAQFDVKDGDIQVNRMDVAVKADSGNSEKDPWDTFDTVSLWVDGDQIASMDAGSKSDWEKDQPSTGWYRLRFTGLNQVFREGDKAEITVGVTLKSSIGDHSGTWSVVVPDNGIRGVDGAGIQEYTGKTSDTTSFDFAQKGNDDQVIVKTSSENPSATTLALEDNKTSDWMTVMAYDLDTKDSVNDITLTTLPVGVVVSTSTFNHFVSDARLVVDGVTYTDWTLNGSDASHVQLDFNIDDNTVITAGDRITAKLQLKFKQLATAYEGSSVYATSTGDLIDATGADTLDSSQLSGGVTGDIMTLRTSGAIFDNFSSTQSQTVDPNSSASNTASFSLKFDVTAFNTDLYINKTAASGTAMGTNGANFIVENNAGAQVTGTSVQGSLSSNASSNTGNTRFIVHEGETKTFTLNVTFDPSTANYYQVQLYGVNFATSDADPTTQQKAEPVSSFTSGQVYVAN